MKVALAFPGCHKRGGVERVMVECANFLASRNHQVHVYATEWDPSVLHPNVVPVDVQCPIKLHLANLVLFPQLVESTRRKHRETYDATGTFGMLSSPGAVTWVGSVHAAWLHISKRERTAAGRLKQMINPAHSLCLRGEKRYFGKRQYAALLAMADGVRNDLGRFYGVPREDVVILPQGYSPDEFGAHKTLVLREAARRDFGLLPTDRTILFAANEYERKGLFPLLRALAELRHQQLRLLVVGRIGSSVLQPVVRRLRLEDKVQLIGPTTDMARYYAAADLFVLPTYYEAWGLVIVEALACGLPVLTSRLAGASVAVKEGWSGELLDDPHSVEEIARKLRVLLQRDHPPREVISESVSQYAWPVVLQKYESILQESASQ